MPRWRDSDDTAVGELQADILIDGGPRRVVDWCVLQESLLGIGLTISDTSYHIKCATETQFGT